MSHASVSSPVRSRWALTSAVLVYESQGGGATESYAYATVHGIETNGKQLRLEAGKPATKEVCAALARSLGAASTLSGFIPEDLLYLGARALVWWRRPAPATMYFNTTKSAAGDQRENKAHAGLIGKRSGRAPQPGLVFAVTPSGWYVYAVKGVGRPDPAAQLWRAPYFNVWANGQVCTGNVRLPETLSTAALQRYEHAFFDSEFTHPNVGARERLLIHPQGSYAFWSGMLDPTRGLTEFPVDVLVDAKLTLEGLVKRLEKGEGASQGDHPPRPEAGEHHADEVGSEAPGLRSREVEGGGGAFR